MKPAQTIIAVFAALLTLPITAFAQNEVASNGAAAEAVDQKSIADLRREVYRAEEDFYDVYNSLNDEKEFDVSCFYEKATGTNIKNHVCRARFVTTAFERHARRNRNSMSRVANQNNDAVLAEKTAIYQENLETLIAANPELEQALIRYNTARAQFTAKREAGSSR